MNQQTETVNDFIRKIFGLLLNTVIPDDINEAVDMLQQVSASKLAWVTTQLYQKPFFDGEETDALFFQPVSHDGIFYPENARKRFESSEFDANIRYIIGSNSYEGNLLWMETIGGRYPFTPQNVTYVFDILKGYSSGEVTLGQKFAVIPEELQDIVVQKYYQH